MRLPKIISVMFGLAILATSCTADADDSSASVTSDVTDDATTSSTKSTTTTTTTTEAPTTTRPTQSLEGAWAETWRVLLGLGPSGLTNAGLASDEAAEALGRLPLDGVTTAEHYPRIEIVSGLPEGTGEMALTDCVLFDNHPPVWLTGNLTRQDENEDWTVSSVEIIDPFGECVPEEVANAAIAGAQAFIDGRNEFWDPADPAHPLIAETTTAEYRTFLEDLLAQHQTEGIRFDSGGSGANLGVFVVDSDSSVVVRNCFAPRSEYGWYGTDGTRTDGSSPVVNNQTNYVEYTMIRETTEDEGSWRVSNVVSSVNDVCDPSSTADLLPLQ